MLKINDLAGYINVFDIPSDWIKYYDEALKHFDNFSFSRDKFDDIIRFYHFDKEFEMFFKDLWSLVESDSNLIFLVFLWYYILYEVNLDKREKWDFKLSYFENHGSLYLPMIAMLLGYKKHEEVMAGYDIEQINFQKNIIREICFFDKNAYGIDGMRFSNMEWGSRFIRGQIVQIGILQYELKKDYFDNEDVIFIHIPRGVKLTQDNLLASFNNKNKVFDYFNISSSIKFMTLTWLLSPELKSILSDDSNIICFQKYFNVVELIENKKDFIKFVFNEPFVVLDYASLKEDTLLQKKLKEKLLNNEKLHIGLGILK